MLPLPRVRLLIVAALALALGIGIVVYRQWDESNQVTAAVDGKRTHAKSVSDSILGAGIGTVLNNKHSLPGLVSHSLEVVASEGAWLHGVARRPCLVSAYTVFGDWLDFLPQYADVLLAYSTVPDVQRIQDGRDPREDAMEVANGRESSLQDRRTRQ
jgi:hypothetical protein